MAYYGYPRNSGVPRLNSYQEVYDWWNNTKPIRGRENQNKRPLGYRNRTYMIAKDEQTNDMVLYLWNEREAVRFKPDGDVVLSAGDYISSSVTNFFGDVFSYYQVRTHVYDHSVVVKLCNENAECRLALGESITIRKGDDGNYHWKDGNNTFQQYIRRKELNALRKNVAGFMKYAVGMSKLQNGEFIAESNFLPSVDLSRHYWHSGAEEFNEAVQLFVQQIHATDGDTKYEQWHSALKTILYSYGRQRYMYNNPNRTYILRPQTVKKAVDEMLMGAFRDIVFERVPVTGSVKRDKYKFFFNSKRWNAYHGSK